MKFLQHCTQLNVVDTRLTRYQLHILRELRCCNEFQLEFNTIALIKAPACAEYTLGMQRIGGWHSQDETIA